MKIRSFLFSFGLVVVCFSSLSCTGPKLFWCTSNGIITYNKHTGQFEMLWEQSAQSEKPRVDTIFLDSIKTPNRH